MNPCYYKNTILNLYFMEINEILKKIKIDYEQAVTTASFDGRTYQNGREAKKSLIRSQRLINHIHEFIKEEFVDQKVNPKIIIPPLNQSNPEIRIKGFLKPKKQDISLVPSFSKFSGLDPINTTQIKQAFESLDDKQIEQILTVNARSQLSSYGKNFDTLYERTYAEAFNLHQKYPKQCLGEVYLISTHPYDDRAMLSNKINFCNKAKIEEYINMFQAINARDDFREDQHKYERVSLLIVDFRQESPKLYSEIDELIKDGLVPKNTKASLKGLTIEDFVKDILNIYSKRFKIKLFKT